jgi:regulator of sirC expression with transglutaminase-like and TPR domain
MELAKAAGAKRVVPLPVSAPFHCALMKPAQDRLKADLDATTFADLKMPLVNNVAAKEIRSGAEARQGLFEQVPNPVRWTDSMNALAAARVERWFEVGAGSVLSGLLRTIVAGAKCEIHPDRRSEGLREAHRGLRMSAVGTPGLIDLIAGRGSDMELDRAALELAAIEYPGLDPEPWIRELDRHAWAIAERAGDLSDHQRFVEAAGAYLFGELGLRGNETDYYHPDNSCLHRVLETGLGIPITLSTIYLEVARRLAKPIRGVGLPSHFLVRYDAPDYSAIIDPFHGGAILTPEQCFALIGAEPGAESAAPELLAPVDRGHIVRRMINNLRMIYFSRRDAARAIQVLDLLIAANPDSPDEHKQKGTALLMGRRLMDAFAEFTLYLKLSPDSPDREQIEEQMRNLAFWMSSRN